MNIKRIIGIVVMLVGVAAILYALNASGRIAEAKGNIEMATSQMPKDATSELIGGILKSKASQYDSQVLALLIGGIALVVVGGAVAICCGRKKRR
ncbi:MAG: hypothetical protein HYX48_00715 [Chlamydiales bacterium]|nr:hypothetical protein [Chlamydiales bacterium]